MPNAYETDLDRNPANFQPLTPLTLLERAAFVFPDQLAIVHGPLRRNYREFDVRMLVHVRSPTRIPRAASGAT